MSIIGRLKLWNRMALQFQMKKSIERKIVLFFSFKKIILEILVIGLF